MALRMAVDIGGTFTDGVLLDDATGRIWLAKSLTTYGDYGDAVAEVTRALFDQHGSAGNVTQIVHGTTLIANTLIERKGVRTALVTNKGMADTLEIRRELRYDTYDLALAFPAPLVDSRDCHEIAGRTGPDGREWSAVSRSEVADVAERLAVDGIRAIAVCLLHAPVSAVHENTVRDALLQAIPDIPVSISCEVSGEIGEYERMSTTVANACVKPVVDDYLNALRTRFRSFGLESRIDIMVSNGGFTTAALAARFPITLLESGPAGGVLGAVNCASLHGTTHVLAFDMGGTTAKSCVAVEGRPDITHVFEFAREQRFKKGSGLPAVVPSIDLIEIGAGGGSIARRTALGLLQVGPESAGSEPGPACYGLGGIEATVTDADLVLGYLDADGFLGGRLPLDHAKALDALACLGEEIGLDPIATAWGVHDIVNENMASAARTHIAEKGHDARRFTVVATGGAGPVHAADVARRLHIRRLLCPIASGVGSCLGFLAAPARADRSWSRIEPVAALVSGAIAERIRAARDEITSELGEADIPETAIAWHAAVEMRYTGQGASIEVPLRSLATPDSDSLTQDFLQTYQVVFGRTVPGGTPETVTWRIWGMAREGTRRFDPGYRKTRCATSPPARSIWLPDVKAFHEVPSYRRDDLEPGMRLRAPCVIGEDESTLVVIHSAGVTVLDDGTIEVILDGVSG